VALTAAADDGAVVLTVADEGPGIPKADVERVFERFYRADPARPGATGGAGLGLSIARWIVELHGGDIRPTPNQPSGCAMVVRLPARQGDDA
jgi:two-component system sensor histidine kinase SenX3